MKKIISLLLLLTTVAVGVLMFSSCGKDDGIDVEYVETEYAGSTLYVYNWGEYISDGSDDSLDVVRMFEKKYDIDVRYDFFSTNEELYAQLSSGAKYDVVIPSDYMIQRMLNEGMLQKLNYANIPNSTYIDAQYKGQYFDPTDEYSIPYAVGMVGIIYNKTMVTEIDKNDPATMTWDLLWSDKYTAAQKINFNNPRDAFGVAMFALGLDVNTTSTADWQAAYDKLAAQDCIYLMDEIYNKMENGTAAMAAYYAGDCLSMMQENSDLDFFYPTEGTNIFIDSMCVPTSAQNKGAAELFINFMLDPEVATANANYICYTSPSTAVRTNENYDYKEGTDYYDYLYTQPDNYDAAKKQYYKILDDDTQGTLNTLWARLGVEDEGGDGSHIGTYIFIGVIAVALLGCVAFFTVRSVRSKKKPAKKA